MYVTDLKVVLIIFINAQYQENRTAEQQTLEKSTILLFKHNTKTYKK